MRFVFAGWVWLASVLPAAANDIERLMTALRMPDVVSVLSEEGIATGPTLQAGFFPNQSGEAWLRDLRSIYDPEAMSAAFKREIAGILEGVDLAPILDFLESDVGERIMTLEVTARVAFADPDMEAAASAAFDNAEEEFPVLYAQVSDFIEVNDLIDGNVDGTHSSNMAFALGLIEGGQFSGLSVGQLAAELWQGEAAARASVRDWLYAYLMTAYKPLPPEDLDAYIKLSATESGQQLNAAILGAFDVVFADISYKSGRSIAFHMGAQEL